MEMGCEWGFDVGWIIAVKIFLALLPSKDEFSST